MTLDTLLNEYSNLIWYLIYGFLNKSNIPVCNAEDIYQDACIRLNDKLPSYDDEQSNIKTFIASNTNIVCMRYRRDYFKHALPELNEMDAKATEPSIDYMQRVLENYETSDLHREIISMKWDGYAQKEIAQELQIAQSTVSRALGHFRDYLVAELKNKNSH